MLRLGSRLGCQRCCARALAPQHARPVPVIVLGRLAVHSDRSGKGIGSGLLKDALLRSIQAADLIGVRALMCHAIDNDARAFYSRHGFAASPLDERMVLVGLR